MDERSGSLQNSETKSVPIRVIRGSKRKIRVHSCPFAVQKKSALISVDQRFQCPEPGFVNGGAVGLGEFAGEAQLQRTEGEAAGAVGRTQAQAVIGRVGGVGAGKEDGFGGEAVERFPAEGGPEGFAGEGKRNAGEAVDEPGGDEGVGPGGVDEADTALRHETGEVQGAPGVTTDVLPHVPVDLVSYSAWDTKDSPTQFAEALAFIAKHKCRTEPFGEHGVYVGEFGLPESEASPQLAFERTAALLAEAQRFGCPYAIYWQLYCNEPTVPLPKVNADYKGFWLVRPDGTRSLVCQLFR